MRKSKTKKISELFSDFFQQNELESNKHHIDPLDLWGDVMGRQIISETKGVNLEENILYISIKNPYLKADLKSQSNKILKQIQTRKPSIIKLVFN